MSVSLKQSYDIEYNGAANVSRMDLFVDTAADLTGLTTFDSITLLQGSTAEDISTGDVYMMQTGGTWVKQPSKSPWSDVYTKEEVDALLLSYYTKAEADNLFVMRTFPITTITGESPIDFIANCTPLTAWSIYGNMTNDAPPEECGDRTANVLNLYSVEQGGWQAAAGTVPTKIENPRRCRYSQFFTVLSHNILYDFKDLNVNIVMMDSEGLSVGGSGFQTGAGSFTLLSNAEKISLIIGNTDLDDDITPAYVQSKNISLDYGYAIPITCGGATQTVYLSEPLRKAIDGSEAVDVMSSDGTITRNVDSDGNALTPPTTESYDAPTITPAAGENTLTVDTTLPPSNISITGQIRSE